jgi:hypothetical protein|tara:strand:- start:34 stop:273 length:240 start_codon:yes stop_codon:yes gene_type:complete
MQVIKIWLLLMIISMPGEKSVRYNAFVYPTEDKCFVAKDRYNSAYEAKPQDYKNKLKSEAFCIPFDSFPLTGLQAPIGA